MPSGREPCYVGFKPCGCAVGAIVPRLCSNRDLMYRLVPWVRRGYVIERVSLDQAREMLQRCPHEPRLAQQAELFPGRSTR